MLLPQHLTFFFLQTKGWWDLGKTRLFSALHINLHLQSHSTITRGLGLLSDMGSELQGIWGQGTSCPFFLRVHYPKNKKNSTKSTKKDWDHQLMTLHSAGKWKRATKHGEKRQYCSTFRNKVGSCGRVGQAAQCGAGHRELQAELLQHKLL